MESKQFNEKDIYFYSDDRLCFGMQKKTNFAGIRLQ